MTDTEIEYNTTYELDEKSQHDLLDSELDTNIRKLSKDLGGYQLNSEKKKAWIVSIDLLNKNKIVVKFLLPSTDKFTKIYEIPNKRLPEDNSFRKLIEETGHEVNSMDLAIGESVNIQYNKSIDSWEPDIQSDNTINVDNKYITENNNNNIFKKILKKSINNIILILLCIPFLLIIFRFARGYGLIAIVSIFIGYYIILTS